MRFEEEIRRRDWKKRFEEEIRAGGYEIGSRRVGMTHGGLEGGARVQTLLQRPDGHIRVCDEVGDAGEVASGLPSARHSARA